METATIALETPIEDRSEIIIGVDEAGRGPLIGPVCTGAIILPNNPEFDLSRLKDSKKFTSKKKINEVFEYINNECEYCVADFAHIDEIDKYNILQATQRSMHRCIHTIITKLLNLHDNDKDKQLEILQKIKICVDGNYFNTFKFFFDDKFFIIPHITLIKGDALCKEISGGSILAKVTRDNYMEDFVKENPEYDEKYGLLKNKGYATKQHIEGIRQHGYSPYHRKSFRLKSI